MIHKTVKDDRRTTYNKFTLLHAEEEKKIPLEFILSTVLPMVSFDFTLWFQVVLFLIFFFSIGYISIRHHIMFTNPYFEINKYNIYECRIRNIDKVENTKLIVANENLVLLKGKEIRIKPLNNQYSIMVGTINENNE